MAIEKQAQMGREGALGQAAFHFELHSPDFEVPQNVQRYVHDKLAAKLAKFSDRLTAVVVRLKDVSGARGRGETECHLEALLAGMEPVNVHERDDDLRAVIDLALDRFEDTVGRHIDKTRTRPRQSRKLARGRKAAAPW